MIVIVLKTKLQFYQMLKFQILYFWIASIKET